MPSSGHIACLLTLAAACAVLASPGSASAQGGPCDGDGGEQGQGRCMAWRLAQADSVLNDTYQAVLVAIDRTESWPPDIRAQEKRNVRQAERAWIQFKDLECDFVMNASGVQRNYFVVRDRCLLELTERRNEQLEAHLRRLRALG